MHLSTDYRPEPHKRQEQAEKRGRTSRYVTTELDFNSRFIEDTEDHGDTEQVTHFQRGPDCPASPGSSKKAKRHERERPVAQKASYVRAVWLSCGRRRRPSGPRRQIRRFSRALGGST